MVEEKGYPVEPPIHYAGISIRKCRKIDLKPLAVTTVDGRNPAPPWMVETLLIVG